MVWLKVFASFIYKRHCLYVLGKLKAKELQGLFYERSPKKLPASG
jgi:hypothetical protein